MKEKLAFNLNLVLLSLRPCHATADGSVDDAGVGDADAAGAGAEDAAGEATGDGDAAGAEDAVEADDSSSAGAASTVGLRTRPSDWPRRCMTECI